jgi:hypothetical protein
MKMRHDLAQVNLGNKTQVGRAGGWFVCFRLKLPTGLVQVDLLLPKRQRPATFVEGHHLHAQNPAVKVAGYVKLFNG